MIPLLADVLTKAGERVECLQNTDGSVALVLEHGGRIIGLYPPDCRNNFLWTNPALASVTSAQQFFRSSQWHNSGGQRTWISPEKEFFLPNYPASLEYLQPRQLDPGTYLLHRRGCGLNLSMCCRLNHLSTGSSLEVTIEKYVTGSEDPLGALDIAGLTYAGFTVQTTLNARPFEGAPIKISLWNLLQISHGGEAVVPTLSRPSFIRYFGDIDDRKLRIQNNGIAYQMSAVGKQKIGLQAHDQIGRIGYLQNACDDACLVVVNFEMDASKQYLDVPWQNPHSPACPVQLCSVQNEHSGFAELEHHSAACTSSCSDIFQIWAYAGTSSAVKQAAKHLLGSISKP
jgi:hypothetical protein